MKKKLFLSLAVATVLLAPAFVPAQALSCLPVDMYLKDVVGKEDEIVIFVGTTKERIEADDYTAEALEVTEALQGYVENELMVYHEKSIDWGYLCNQGPGKKGDAGVYITHRDAHGKYAVYQRLTVTDPLVETLREDLEEAAIEGGVSEIEKTDRLNQIVTTIRELFAEIGVLLKELRYWQNAR